MLPNLLLALFALLAGVLVDITRPLGALLLVRPGPPSRALALAPVAVCLAVLECAPVAVASSGPLPPPPVGSSVSSAAERGPAVAEDTVGGGGLADHGSAAGRAVVSPSAWAAAALCPWLVAASAAWGQNMERGIDIAGLFAGFKLHLNNDKTREHLDALFYYLLGLITVCQYVRGDFDDGDDFEEDEDDNAGDVENGGNDDEWEDIEYQDEGLNDLPPGIDHDDDTDWEPPANAIAIIDINPADGQRRIVWANPEDIWGHPADMVPEEAHHEDPVPLLDLAASVVHPLCLAWHLAAIWAFRPRGALPWLEVFRLVLHGQFVAAGVLGNEWLPGWMRHIVRFTHAVGRVWSLCDGVRDGRRPTLLQLAASGTDLWLWGRFQVFLFRKWWEGEELA